MLVSVSLSVISIVMVSMITLRKQVTSQYHVENDQTVDVSAVISEYSQRMRRLEENLVDQKVKLEILELRLERFSESQIRMSPNQKSRETEPMHFNEISAVPEGLNRFEVPSKLDQRTDSDKRLGDSEREALRLVFEGRGKTTAKDIQRKIGRTREHTARMMNGLFQEGLVERDITVRPFAYSITQRGRDLLNS